MLFMVEEEVLDPVLEQRQTIKRVSVFFGCEVILFCNAFTTVQLLTLMTCSLMPLLQHYFA